MMKPILRKNIDPALSCAALQSAAAMCAHYFRGDSPLAAQMTVKLAGEILDQIEAAQKAKEQPRD